MALTILPSVRFALIVMVVSPPLNAVMVAVPLLFETVAILSSLFC